MKSGKLQKFHDVRFGYSATLRKTDGMIKYVLRIYDPDGNLVNKMHFGTAYRAKEYLNDKYPGHWFNTVSGYVCDDDD